MRQKHKNNTSHSAIVVMEALEAAYDDAEKDLTRKNLVKEWSSLDTLDDIVDWVW